MIYEEYAECPLLPPKSTILQSIEAILWYPKTRNQEQLRALDNNITINVALANSSPIGVDTEEDYLALKKIMEYKA